MNLKHTSQTAILIAICTLLANRALPGTPNIVLVMTDDQGYGELSCHGNPVVQTPHLDRLASESVRFTDFHVAPMCTPTRGQLLTGVDCLRNGAMNVSSGRTLLRTKYPTLAELLKQKGYRSGHFGKWHLGDNYPYRPHDRGFDESIWYPSSHIGSTPDVWENDYFDDVYWHRNERQKYAGYTTDVFFQEAMKWIKPDAQETHQPFFLYIATAAAHGPLYVPEKYRDAVRPRLQAAIKSGKLPKFDHKQSEQLIRYLAMVENIDENFGKLEKYLVDNNLRENTIVIFLTDNGSTWGSRYFDAGMTGNKVTLWEGGHRVPCFIRWPEGEFGKPREISELTQSQDIVPTLCELCDVSSNNVDGVSLVPLLRGQRQTLDDRMLVINYSRMPVQGREQEVVPKKSGAAVLWKRWRLIENERLYDLTKDPFQLSDVASTNPEVVQKMRVHLDKWWEGVKGDINVPQRVIIGHEAENPTMLTACEWWDVFIDQQAQVRRGERKRGRWHLDAASAGKYEIEIRRWPREADLPLRAAAPAAHLADGNLVPGVSVPIAQATLQIGERVEKQELTDDAKAAVFQVELKRGPMEMQADFNDAEGEPLLGAYYAYVRKL